MNIKKKKKGIGNVTKTKSDGATVVEEGIKKVDLLARLKKRLRKIKIDEDADIDAKIKEEIERKISNAIGGSDNENVFDLVKNNLEGLFIFNSVSRDEINYDDDDKKYEKEILRYFATRKDSFAGSFTGRNVIRNIIIRNHFLFKLKLYEVDFDEEILNLLMDIGDLQVVNEFLTKQQLIQPIIDGILKIAEKHGDKLNDMIWEEAISMYIRSANGMMTLRNGIYVLIENPPPTESVRVDPRILTMNTSDLNTVYLQDGTTKLDTNYLVFAVNIFPYNTEKTLSESKLKEQIETEEEPPITTVDTPTGGRIQFNSYF